MLDLQKTAQALETKRQSLAEAQRDSAHGRRQAEEAMDRLSQMSYSEAVARLEPTPWPGAYPTPEHDRHRNQVVPFPHRFANHPEAREWALEVLRGRPTFAVDGSHILPLPELSLPVGLAQAAWYLNLHTDNGDHERDLAVEVLTGGDSTSDSDEGDNDGNGLSVRVQARRFQMEIRALTDFLGRWGSRQPTPVCFLDDPLTVPLAQGSGEQRRRGYISAVSALLEASERDRIPVIGYTADPGSYDLLEMLRSLGLLSHGRHIGDAVVFARALPAWGDRSPVYICARTEGVLEPYRRSDGSSLSDQIAFCYLRANTDGLPARIEFPRWLAEDEARLSQALDVVRAECIIGFGFPYAIEAADGTAVLSGQDRQRFQRLLTEFAQNHGLALASTTKATSKRRRRRGG